MAKQQAEATPMQLRMAKARAAKAAKKNQPVGRPIDEDEPIVRTGMQPKRAGTRQPVRQQPREPDRQPSRRGTSVMVTGRDGEVLSRRLTFAGDVYFVPPNEIPSGWDYQWNTFSVHGREDNEMQVLMHANGWRPVPAERHAGRWTAPNYKGAVIVKGLRLEERPTALGNEARAEEEGKARTQMRDQTDSLRLTEKMPAGFESRRSKYRGTGGEVRIQIDPAIDVPRPTHEIEE
jgi:hypothetical protein